MTHTVDRSELEELVYETCARLDEKDFKGFLGLCDPAFAYKVSAYAPEVQREMTWLDRDRAEIEEFFGMLPKHNTDRNPLSRHAQVTKVRLDAARQRAEVTSTVQIFRTQLDGGATELFAVGRYLDTISLQADAPRLLARHVKLDTRDLGWGTHLPL
ncbi:MAG: methanesulfonate monooxygenase [Betaproteobacteria bacterium]|nr:methanesulfonate monooxygenase [Betaproteobacteria bacterium]